tara:strand:+ start:524 stop:949 length:426 start_codon:yes stop_codon:yes gene_type:complete
MSNKDDRPTDFARNLTHCGFKFKIYTWNFTNEKQARKCIELMTARLLKWDDKKARKKYALLSLIEQELLYSDDEIYNDVFGEFDKCVQKALTPKTRISNSTAECGIEVDKTTYFTESVKWGTLMLKMKYWEEPFPTSFTPI